MSIIVESFMWSSINDEHEMLRFLRKYLKPEYAPVTIKIELNNKGVNHD